MHEDAPEHATPTAPARRLLRDSFPPLSAPSRAVQASGSAAGRAAPDTATRATAVAATRAEAPGTGAGATEEMDGAVKRRPGRPVKASGEYTKGEGCYALSGHAHARNMPMCARCTTLVHAWRMRVAHSR
jgi:hypothetical protein